MVFLSKILVCKSVCFLLILLFVFALHVGFVAAGKFLAPSSTHSIRSSCLPVFQSIIVIVAPNRTRTKALCTGIRSTNATKIRINVSIAESTTGKSTTSSYTCTEYIPKTWPSSIHSTKTYITLKLHFQFRI